MAQVLSSDGHFALSGSWDKTLRLWDLSTGKTTRRFEDHTKDVLSVAFSADNRQIVSAARDKTIKVFVFCLNILTISPLTAVYFLKCVLNLRCDFNQSIKL